jgi:hypothetical protein
MDKKLFGLSPKFIELIDELFPDRLPRTQVTLEELARLQGQRDVIEKIKELLETEEDLTYVLRR